MRQTWFSVGPREFRLVFQNAPNPEQLPPSTTASEGGEYTTLTPDQIRAIETARDERLAPLRAAEGRSREEDLRQLSKIEEQIAVA